MDEKLRKDLIAAKVLIDTPEKWQRRSYHNAELTSFCTFGALDEICGGEFRAYPELTQAIRDELPDEKSNIVDYNDDPAHHARRHHGAVRPRDCGCRCPMTSPQRPRAAATPTATPEGVTAELLPCPLCGETLEIRTGANPYGRHSKDSDCFFAAHAVNIPHDVERWNRRAPDLAARQEIARLTGERDEARAHHEYFAIESDNRKYALAAQAQHRDEVVEALRGLLDRYTELVNCGDCGDWDPEKEPVVIASRAALITPEPK